MKWEFSFASCIWRAGKPATCRRDAMFMSGPTGVYLQARMEPQAECILVLIGATPEGKRSFWACRRACGKAARAGRNCLSI